MDALFRKLGMDRPITRRDFLNGMAVTVASTQIPGTGLMAQAVRIRGRQRAHGRELSAAALRFARQLSCLYLRV